MKTFIAIAVRSAITAAAIGIAAPAFAAGGDVPHIEKQQWSFSGPFGTFDKAQVQRGLKVYQEVCASCHGLSYVAFRNLADLGGPGFTEEQAKVIAADYEVEDGPDDAGDMFERPAKLTDYFPSPFPNEQAARASNGGAYPPDLSLMAKARAGHRGFPWFIFDAFTQYQEYGADYIYALMIGYEEAPEGLDVPEGQYYNHSFLAGKTLAMAPPLSDELVEYTDGTPMTTEQYARDISAFLMWTAEPKMEERKKIGLRVMIFLIIFASLLYFTKKKIWRNVAH
ncbi:MAG: cytochrome c1 [Stappiaceae bacterium]